MSEAERTKALFRELKIPNELALEFFITFSRFEYALKQAGFVKADGTNWDAFGAKLTKFDTAAVLERCAYMRAKPPKKQILDKDGKSEWEQPKRDKSAIENTLLDLANYLK